MVSFVAPRNKIDHMLIVTSDITRCTLVLANAGRGFGENEDEWTVKVEVRSRKKFLAEGKVCVAIF